METNHPNLALLERLDLTNLSAAGDLFAQDFVWHYVNPNLPDMEADYEGVAGLQRFFRMIGEKTGGTFKVDVLSAIPLGDEFVVVHVRDTMVHQGTPIAIDAVVVWRFADGRIKEAWDIPAAYTLAKAR